MKISKREVMKNAWKLFKKNFSQSFSDCLKASWNLNKRIQKFDNRTNINEATEIVNSKQNLRNRFQDANLAVKNNERKLDYTGKAMFTVENAKIWAVKNIARIYFAEYLDSVIAVENAYIETRI